MHIAKDSSETTDFRILFLGGVGKGLSGGGAASVKSLSLEVSEGQSCKSDWSLYTNSCLLSSELLGNGGAHGQFLSSTSDC